MILSLMLYLFGENNSWQVSNPITVSRVAKTTSPKGTVLYRIFLMHRCKDIFQTIETR